jgi:hypothetical protein
MRLRLIAVATLVMAAGAVVLPASATTGAAGHWTGTISLTIDQPATGGFSEHDQLTYTIVKLLQPTLYQLRLVGQANYMQVGANMADCGVTTTTGKWSGSSIIGVPIPATASNPKAIWAMIPGTATKPGQIELSGVTVPYAVTVANSCHSSTTVATDPPPIGGGRYQLSRASGTLALSGGRIKVTWQLTWH